MPSPFGPEEGAVLVAVERANGGELAPLQQVLGALDAFTPAASRPSPAEFANSARLVIELGVVEYVDGQLGLSPAGRKLLRRSGMPNDPRHVAIVTELLQEFDELDLDRDKSSTGPTEADVKQAVSDRERIEETPGAMASPMIGAPDPTPLSILGLGTTGLVNVPEVAPADSVPVPEQPELAPEQPEPAPEMGAPAHPILDRLFGHRRGKD